MSSRGDPPPFSFLNFPWTISSRWGNIIEKTGNGTLFHGQVQHLKAILRPRRVSRGAGGTHRLHSLWARCAVRHADGRGQVALLSDPRAAPAGHHARRLAAHLADEGSGRSAQERGRSRGVHQQLTDRRADPHGLRPHAQGCLQAHLRRARAVGNEQLFIADAGDGRVVSRCGRGTLHFAVGTGLPPELPRHCRFHQCPAAQTHCRGLHRDGDKAGAVRHSAALAAAKPVPHRDGLRPSEPLFRRAPPEKQVFRPRRTH